MQLRHFQLIKPPRGEVVSARHRPSTPKSLQPLSQARALAKSSVPQRERGKGEGSKREERGSKCAWGAGRRAGRGHRETHCKGEFVGPAREKKASPRSCNTLFLQCAALGLGEGEEGKQLPGEQRAQPGPARSPSGCRLCRGESASSRRGTPPPRPCTLPPVAPSSPTLPLPPSPPPPSCCCRRRRRRCRSCRCRLLPATACNSQTPRA